MSAQMSLLDAVLAPRPVVATSREAVVALGCNAPGVPAHEVLPFVPGVSPETARVMLEFVERAVRCNAGSAARIDGRLDARNGVGSNGPTGSGLLMSETKGLRHIDTREFIPWTRLLAALRHAREMEPETARARPRRSPPPAAPLRRLRSRRAARQAAAAAARGDRGPGRRPGRAHRHEPMTDQPTATVTIVDHHGALEAGEAPATRTVQAAGLAPKVAGGLAAAVLSLPPSWPTPGPGTHRTPKAGGYVAVTITPDAEQDAT